MEACSPRSGRQGDRRVPGSCLLPEDIQEAGRLWNERADVQARIPAATMRDPSRILQHIHDHTGTRLGEEDAWAKRFVPASSPLYKRLKDALRPRMPDEWMVNEYSWLSNFDIEQVLRQYESVFPAFLFLGVFPMDFRARDKRTGECIGAEMCAFDVAEAWARGKRLVTAVLNLDYHDSGGSHWVCLNIGLDPQMCNYGIFYYDSVAKPATPEVSAFARDVAAAVQAFHSSAASFPPTRLFRVAHNSVRRQFQDTECGVFALFCCLCFLHGNLDFDDICGAMGTDDMIHRFRSVFFRPPTNKPASKRT